MIGREVIRLVDTSDRAELKRCIENARHVASEMGTVINRISSDREKRDLLDLTSKMEILLNEADQRYHQFLR